MTRLTGRLVKLQFGGPLFLSELWTCSIHMQAVGDAAFEVPASSFELPLKDWFSRLSTGMNQNAKLDFVKANEVHRSTLLGVHKAGQYVNPGAANNHIISPAATSSTGVSVPGQLTVATTFRTNVVRGRGSHGRIYPPTKFANALIDGTIAADLVQGLADSTQELLSELNAVGRQSAVGGDDDYFCVVWSGVGGFGETIERVAVGDVVDTQRRRRAQLRETYTFAVANV